MTENPALSSSNRFRALSKNRLQKKSSYKNKDSESL